MKIPIDFIETLVAGLESADAFQLREAYSELEAIYTDYGRSATERQVAKDIAKLVRAQLKRF